MRIIIFTVFLLNAFCISGCELHQVKGQVAGVEVEAKTKEGTGSFCPPGQAKKGNC